MPSRKENVTTEKPFLYHVRMLVPWDKEAPAASLYAGPESLLGRQPVTGNEYPPGASQPVERKGLPQLVLKAHCVLFLTYSNTLILSVE